MGDVLITGSSGIIGSVLQEGLKYDIRPFDLPEYDARDYDQLLAQLLGSSAIVHLAWNTETDNYSSGYTDPENYGMAQNVFRAALASGVSRIIIASSIHADMGYGSQNTLRSPYDLPKPDSPYGATKAGIEALGRYYSRQNLEVVCIRFGWVSPNVEDLPDPTKPYPLNEGWLSHGDCVALVSTCLASSSIPDNYQIMWGVSHRKGSGSHDLRNVLGWRPQSSYDAPLR